MNKFSSFFVKESDTKQAEENKPEKGNNSMFGEGDNNSAFCEGDKIKYLEEGKWREGYVESPEEDGKVLVDGVRIPTKLIKPMNEGDKSKFQAFKHDLMQKHGFKDWETASKDKDFMNALDRGWNAADEEGKDGKN